MSKQTAVDYLFQTLCGDKSYYNRYTNEVMDYINHAYQKAKAMEREQILDSWENGFSSNQGVSTYGYSDRYQNTAEKYYNETYKVGEQ